jgi:hypothetical protein
MAPNNSRSSFTEEGYTETLRLMAAKLEEHARGGKESDGETAPPLDMSSAIARIAKIPNEGLRKSGAEYLDAMVRDSPKQPIREYFKKRNKGQTVAQAAQHLVIPPILREGDLEVTKTRIRVNRLAHAMRTLAAIRPWAATPSTTTEEAKDLRKETADLRNHLNRWLTTFRKYEASISPGIVGRILIPTSPVMDFWDAAVENLDTVERFLLGLIECSAPDMLSSARGGKSSRYLLGQVLHVLCDMGADGKPVFTLAECTKFVVDDPTRSTERTDRYETALKAFRKRILTTRDAASRRRTRAPTG